MTEYVVSWDVARQTDATVIQAWRRTPEFVGEDNRRTVVYLDLVYQIKMEQVPYTEQVRRLKLLLSSAELSNNHVLLMDGTGVGQAVADLVREQGMSPVEIVFSGGVKPQPLYVGGADRRFGSGEDVQMLRGYSVPKRDMVDAAKVMMEQRRIRIADGVPHTSRMREELMHFTGRVNDKGHTQYGNDGEAKHDDFVAAFLMACWWVRLSSADTDGMERRSVGSSSYDWNPLLPI